MKDDTGKSPGAGISRREFLKIAGVAGAAVGLSAGLGGLLAACGEESDDHYNTHGAADYSGDHRHHRGRQHHHVSVAAEMGREIKVGCVMPKTGPLAAFGPADEWAAGV